MQTEKTELGPRFELEVEELEDNAEAVACIF
jgi:hypothetical protein